MDQAKTISSAFHKISQQSSFCNVWLCDETWTRAIRSRYPDVQKITNFSVKSLNRALSKVYGLTYQRFDESNLSSIYSCEFFMQCLYDASTLRNVRFYYRSCDGRRPSPPSCATDVGDMLARSHRAQKDRERLTSSEREERKDDKVANSIHELANQQQQRQRNATPPPEGVSAGVGPGSEHSHALDAGDVSNIHNLFGFAYDVVGVVDALRERIGHLKKVNVSQDGYQVVIPMTEDSVQCLSSHDIFNIRNKSLFLLRAYQIVLQKYTRVFR